MKKISSKAESKDQSGKYASLIQQLKSLEIEWKSLQKSSSRNNPRARSSDPSSILTSFDQLLLEKSPRGLMSTLQHRKSSPSPLRLKNCDTAVEEILRDRRAAITSGKIKGRRLFRPEDSDGGGEISSDWLGMAMVDDNICSGGKIRSLGRELHDEMSVGFDQSCSFSDNSSLPEEKVVVEEKSGGDRKLRGGGGYMVAVAWFAFGLILVTLGLISMSCNGKYVEENELILVPT